MLSFVGPHILILDVNEDFSSNVFLGLMKLDFAPKFLNSLIKIALRILGDAQNRLFTSYALRANSAYQSSAGLACPFL